MKILVIGDPHGDLKRIKKIPIKNVDVILLNGDLGKADLARKLAFEFFDRKAKGLPEREISFKESFASVKEIYFSVIALLKYLSRKAEVYTIMGNVWQSDLRQKKEERKFGKKFPMLLKDIRKMKKVHLVRNSVRTINGLRIGFLEYFTDTNWVEDFKPVDYNTELKKAKKETAKAKKVLKRFGNLDVLVCHQPPYGVLDKVSFKKAPKHWQGKHAGSKVILDYIKKHQPRYVFCGHIHEAKGKKKIGKTEVYNLGYSGYRYLNI